MSRVFVIAVILFAGISSYAQNNVDVIHYNFSIELSDQSDTIKGATYVTLLNTGNPGSFTLDLTQPNQKTSKGMSVVGVRLLSPVDKKAKFVQENDKLIISPEYDLKKTDTLQVLIQYQGIPSDGLIISKNKYGERTFFSDNWPDRAHNWIPCNDNIADKASFEFLVIAPSHYQVISNGIWQAERQLTPDKKITRWLEPVPLSTKVMVIGVARFAVKTYADSPEGIPITAWVYPQDSARGFRNYSYAPGIVKYLSDYVGPYPYNKLANVQSKTIFGGMENASAIFYYEESAASPTPVEDLLAHEITHQWFGDMASEKSFAHLWLSEGFATYFTDMYFGKKYGKDSMNQKLRSERRTVIGFAKRSDRPVVDTQSKLMELLNANSYQKGAWVLHMIHREVRDSAFHLIIKNYYNRYKGKNANTDDLRAVVEEVTKKSWKDFFQQWLYKPGIPVLDVKWQYDDAGKKMIVTVTQTQKQDPFQFPLTLQLVATDGFSRSEVITVTKKSETFSLPIKSKIESVILDPDTSLLFDGKIEKL